MRYANEERTLIAGTLWGDRCPVGLFSERGGDIKEVEPYVKWEGDINVAKAALLTAVDQHADALRLALVGTESKTQLEVYRNKYERAVAGDLVFLQDEAVARNVSVSTLSAIIIKKGDEWRIGGQLIEAAKSAHKTAIDALSDVAAAEVYDITTGWPA